MFETRADTDVVAGRICADEATPIYANATLVCELQALSMCSEPFSRNERSPIASGPVVSAF